MLLRTCTHHTRIYIMHLYELEDVSRCTTLEPVQANESQSQSNSGAFPVSPQIPGSRQIHCWLCCEITTPASKHEFVVNFEEVLQDQFVCGLAVEIAVGMEAAAQKVSTPAASTQVIHRYTKLVPVAARSEATQSVFVVEDQDIERHSAPCGQQYATHVDRRATSELFAAQLGRGSLQGSHPRV